MKRLATLSGVAALGLFGQSAGYAYSTIAQVTFEFGGQRNVGWTSSGTNTLDVMTNDTIFNDPANNEGANSDNYINAGFAEASDNAAGTTDDCLTPLPGYESITLRKYGCRVRDTQFSTSPYADVFNYGPLKQNITDDGPAAKATGLLTVTDTTLTGTLTIVSTVDEPSGATTNVVLGVNISNSIGNGANGYNYRTADGSPFGNAWYGISTEATFDVNLTGNFTAESWEITGGSAKFSDPKFMCQQGGYGGDARGTLCTPATTGGGFAATGGHLSWGIDEDGSGTGQSEPNEIEVRSTPGGTVLLDLGGVRASATVNGAGAISTTSGETRRGSGSASNGCVDHIVWDGTKISCGSLLTADLVITGTVIAEGSIVGTDGDDELDGTASADTMYGLAGNDAINGLGGGDTIDGGLGNDTMQGGLGNDIMYVDATGDGVIELGGEGTDTVKSSITYTLPDNVEKLILLGTGALNGTGNTLVNTLTGNSGNNVLNGKAGADTMSGKAGNDTYIVGTVGDKVVESASQGTDTVKSSISYTLPANVEKLTLTGSNAINGTGNTRANVITGNSGANTLAGKEGNDTLKGAAGKDRFLFNTAPNARTNLDKITDFTPIDDVIRLENSVFTALTTTGTLAADAFSATANATTNKHRILYDPATGNVWYDSDGTGPTAKVRVAVLTTKPAITRVDFYVQ